MVHYPNHVRNSFLQWVDDGCPERANWEENYEQMEIDADELLRRFLLPAGCTDIMPGQHCELVGEEINYDGPSLAGLTYAIAAMALLVNRTSGAETASRFLDRLLNVREEV